MQILPPEDVSDVPDKYTKKGVNDYTADSAEDRVLYVSISGFLRYGTNDKAHAAAIILSTVLLFITIVVIVAGFFVSETTWLDKVFTWSTSAFLFAAGVALGKGSSKDGNRNDA